MDLLENTAWKYGRWFYTQVEHIYVPSPSIGDELRAQGITNGIKVWERGVDAQRFSPDHRSLEWRLAHGFTEKDVIVTYVGRLVWEKKLSVFAEVIESLKAQGIPHQSLVVGDGPVRDALRERLTDTVFTGRLHGEELSSAYASSDIFLFPSDTETFGNVTLEAMASGLPTVCADAAGSDLLVMDGKTGYLAPPNDTPAFLAHVKTLISNPSLRTKMGKAARSRAEAFEWKNVMGHLASYYEEIWHKRNGDGGNGVAAHGAAVNVPVRKAVA